ncbi:MAG: hypothetical protein IJA97_04900 [Clostridia bacterium]|nr:hypothetical protein [Clostridia bacterium]
MEDREFIEKENQTETVTVKCESCGANMTFDPETQMLKCPHCGTVTDFEKSSKVQELDILSAFGNAETWKDESSVYRCENCGAVVVLMQGETATGCPYCGTSHVVKTTEMAGLKPNAVFPFTVTKQTALEKAKVWAKSKLFAPSKFKKNLHEENFRGVYQPCFTFDSRTQSVYRARLGTRHTRTVGSGKNRRTETYIVWRTVSGVYDDFFDDVMINADTAYSQKTLNKILPFDINTAKVYDSEYMTGFMAKRSDRKIEDCWSDAKASMDAIIQRRILSRYHYHVVDYINVSTSHSSVTYKYVLLPIYLLNYRYNKKNYSVHVNGNTAKITGKTPVSPWRVLFAVGLSLGIIVLLGLLFYFFS